MGKLRLIKIEDFELGFARLKEAKLELAGGEDLYEYKKAEFEIKNFDQAEVFPSSFYALKSRMEFLKLYKARLWSDLKIDLFHLPGILYLRDGDKIFGLVPPIVEIYPEEDGVITAVLQDGIHRILLAKEMSEELDCLRIINKKADLNYLPYAYPNSWEAVNLVDKVPEIKKKYRRILHYSFMRPLSSIFDQKIVSHWADYGRKR